MTKIAERVGGARWSPDGAWIMFMAECPGDCVEQIMVIRPNGQDRHVVVRDAFAGDWSPGGERIVFYRFLPQQEGRDQAELFTIGRDGRGQVRLTSTTRWSEGAPAWSPDGKSDRVLAVVAAGPLPVRR